MKGEEMTVEGRWICTGHDEEAGRLFNEAKAGEYVVSWRMCRDCKEIGDTGVPEFWHLLKVEERWVREEKRR